MTTPTVEYRGHTIRWSDNGDCWSCMDLGRNSENASLTKIKAAIDRLYLNERKQSAVECFEISSHSASIYSTNVIEYLGAKRDRWSKQAGDDHYIASVAQRDGSDKPSRRETNLNNLMPDTPEARAAFNHYMTKARARKQAEAAEREAFAAIPRMTINDIQPLVELYKRENT